MTGQGEVVFERQTYECRECRKSTVPLDAEMGLVPHARLTHAVRKKVAWAAAHHSHEQAAAELEHQCGLRVSSSECCRVAREVGERLEKKQRAREAAWAAPCDPDRPHALPQFEARRLVVQADATAVLTRAGEDHKMVWLGTAFELDDRIRKEPSPGGDAPPRVAETTAKGDGAGKGRNSSRPNPTKGSRGPSPGGARIVEMGPGPGPGGERVAVPKPGRPLIATRRYTASAGDFEAFGLNLRGLAARMGGFTRGCQQIVFIADGQPCLWKWAEENLPGAVLIQDFWHVSERLHKTARQLQPAPEQAAAQGAQWSALLRASRLDELLELLESEHRRRRGENRHLLRNLITHLTNVRERLDYARYEAQGLPIGSGAVEGGCKHVVKERFGVTGARWKRSRISSMLALRQSIFNEEWETDWKHTPPQAA